MVGRNYHIQLCQKFDLTVYWPFCISSQILLLARPLEVKFSFKSDQALFCDIDSRITKNLIIQSSPSWSTVKRGIDHHDVTVTGTVMVGLITRAILNTKMLKILSIHILRYSLLSKKRSSGIHVSMGRIRIIRNLIYILSHNYFKIVAPLNLVLCSGTDRESQTYSQESCFKISHCIQQCSVSYSQATVGIGLITFNLEYS